MTLEKATKILSKNLREYDSSISYDIEHLTCFLTTGFRVDCIRAILQFEDKYHLFSNDTLEALNSLLILKKVHKKDLLNTYTLMLRDLNLEE